MSKTVILKNLSLSFQNKPCFEDFSYQIEPSSRIAIIGRNGSGKTSLLKLLNKQISPSYGSISIPKDTKIGYLEQTINKYPDLSGGQSLNKSLTEVLSKSPDILLLDEPTNHLDSKNRKSLMRMLNNFWGTLVIVTHDVELIKKCTDTIWHIDNNEIKKFTGSYEDYISEIKKNRESIERELNILKQDKKETHSQLMQEQKRASKSKQKGQKSIEQRKWPTVVSKAKALRAEQTSGKNRASIDKKKEQLTDKLNTIKLPEVILPKFSITTDNINDKNIISISSGSISYQAKNPVLKNISLSLYSKERIAILGDNASGKSSLIKAILDFDHITKEGSWHIVKREDIGYLDQHYSNLNPELSVIEHIKQLCPNWNETNIRRHLNDFLFRNNDDIQNCVKNLSGGEKARLSLCLIAAKTPQLLILDEVTNNIDLETKEHVTQVLKDFPGAMIIVSHESNFIKNIGINSVYEIKDNSLYLKT